MSLIINESYSLELLNGSRLRVSAVNIYLAVRAMMPSEAQILGSTLGNLFSKKPKNARYTRLRSSEGIGALEETSVHISDKRGPSCCRKMVVFFAAFLLLCALIGSMLYVFGSSTYTVQVQMVAGNTLTYHFDQNVTISATKNPARSCISGRISFWVVNKTDTECWLHTEFSPTQAGVVEPSYLFALRIQHKDKYNDDSVSQNYKLFGEAKMNKDLAHHIHCLLNQVLPVVKVKLYKAFLSRVSSSYKQVLDTSSPFLPGRIKLHQSLSITDRLVTITNRAGSHDFMSFITKKHPKRKTNEIAWNFGYNETTVLNKETGMAVTSDLNLTANVPLGEASSHHVNNLDTTAMKVSFCSKVKLLPDQSQDMEQTRFEHVKWTFLPLPETLSHPKVSYFAPQNKQRMDLQELLNDSVLFLSEGPKSRFGKLPAIVALRHSDLEFDDEDSFDRDEEKTEDDDDENDAQYEDADARADVDARAENDDWQTLSPPPPPVPDFAPFGFEDKRRKRRRASAEYRMSSVADPVRKSEKLTRTNLNSIWDELSASTLSTYPKRTLQVLRTSLFGMAVFGEVEYEVKVEEEQTADEEDDEDDEDEEYEDNSPWNIMLSFYLDVGPYRFTTFKKVHRLKSLRRELLRIKGSRQTVKHWKEKAGDLVVCVPLFYLQKVCVEMRLVFALTLAYRTTKFSMTYPVELSVHIEHTVMVNSAMSAHVSTWFHKGGLYSTGGLAVAKLPLIVSFREDTRPGWCTKSNIELKMIELSRVPFAQWNCSLSHGSLSRTCKGNDPQGTHSFKDLAARSPFWQNWQYLDSCEDGR